MFSVNDRVQWTSSARGSVKTKTGTVVAVVPAHGLASEAAAKLLASDSNLRCLQLGTAPRPDESYLVALDASPKGKVRVVHWPRASVLVAVSASQGA